MNGIRSSIWGQLIVAASLVAGCTSPETSAPPANGSVDIALIGESSDGNLYRLRNAFFAISGPTFNFLSSDFDPDASTVSTFLPAGSYEIFLEFGWTLERIDESGRGVEVAAELISANPMFTFVEAGRNSRVVFQFATNGSVVTMDSGRVEIGIEVVEVDGSIAPPSLDAGFPTFFVDSAQIFQVDARFPTTRSDSGPNDVDAALRDPNEGFLCPVLGRGFCPDGTACFATSASSSECLPPGMGQAGDPCSIANECAEGFACGDSFRLPQCFEVCDPGTRCLSGGSCLDIGTGFGVCFP